MSWRIIQVQPSRNPRWRSKAVGSFEAEDLSPVYCGERVRDSRSATHGNARAMAARKSKSSTMRGTSATKIRACSFSSGARQSRRRPEEIAFVSDGDSSFGQLEQINESSIIILANPRLEWESAASGVPRSSVSALYFSSHQFDNVSRGASFEHRLRIYKASAFRSSARSNVTRIAEYFQAMEHIHCIRCFILR